MEEIDQILIERYLAGEATEVERREVALRKLADPVFRQEVEGQETVREALRLTQRDELRERFRRRDVELDKKKPELTTHDRRWYIRIGVAATFLLLLILLWNFFIKPGPTAVPGQVESDDTTDIRKEVPVQDSTMKKMPEEEVKKPKKQNMDMAGEDTREGELFAANFEPYRDPMMDPTTRGESKTSPLDDFRIAYWDERYQDVPALFQKLDPTYQQNDNYRFQLANALLKTGKTEDAIVILGSVIANSKSKYAVESHFYLGMAYLETGDVTRAVEWLDKYVQYEKGKQKEKASAILLALKK